MLARSLLLTALLLTALLLTALLLTAIASAQIRSFSVLIRGTFASLMVFYSLRISSRFFPDAPFLRTPPSPQVRRCRSVSSGCARSSPWNSKWQSGRKP